MAEYLSRIRFRLQRSFWTDIVLPSRDHGDYPLPRTQSARQSRASQIHSRRRWNHLERLHEPPMLHHRERVRVGHHKTSSQTEGSKFFGDEAGPDSFDFMRAGLPPPRTEPCVSTAKASALGSSLLHETRQPGESAGGSGADRPLHRSGLPSVRRFSGGGLVVIVGIGRDCRTALP